MTKTKWLIAILLITVFAVVYGWMGSKLAFYIGGTTLQMVHLVTTFLIGYGFGSVVFGILYKPRY